MKTTILGLYFVTIIIGLVLSLINLFSGLTNAPAIFIAINLIAFSLGVIYSETRKWSWVWLLLVLIWLTNYI